MSKNVRINKSRPKSAQDLLQSPGASRKPTTLKAKAQDLEKTLHRLEVEIAATSRLDQERKIRNRNTIPAPERTKFARSQRRLTHAQTREKSRKRLMQVMEFTVTALLFVGACAGLYQWWLSRGGN